MDKLKIKNEQLKIKNKLPAQISKKHFDRKFGKKKYYGQRWSSRVTL